MIKAINKNQLLELICIFIITLIYNLTCNILTEDEIWNYGFAYNIANGLIPYKNFNMVITPLFPIISGIFMILFGKNIVIFHIFNSLICTMIFYLIKENIPKAYFIVYAILLMFTEPNYNLCCLLFLYILITLEKKKTNDYLIGIILGLTFITKQNIGILLFIPTIFTKNITNIIKRVIGFLIPNTILLIYLLYNKTLYSFINYCFLGLGSFNKNNYFIYTMTLFIFVISITYIIYKYIKTKDISLLYMLSFYGMAYPIADRYHVMIPFVPVFGYFLNTLNLNKKVIKIAFIIYLLFIIGFNYYQYYKHEYNYPNVTNSYKYRKISGKIDYQINIITDYIKESDKNTFILDGNGYLIRLNIPTTTSKYDLLNNGNMGKNGDIKIINEFTNLCQKEKCTFLLVKEEPNDTTYSQYNEKIHNYVINNYNENGKILGYSIYSNYMKGSN